MSWLDDVVQEDVLLLFNFNKWLFHINPWCPYKQRRMGVHAITHYYIYNRALSVLHYILKPTSDIVQSPP